MKITLRLLLLVFLTASFVQSNDSKYLFWTPDTQLKWGDFHGHIRAEDDAVASASYIGFLSRIKTFYPKDSVLLDTRTFFNKSKSWVKIPVLIPTLLSHERLHFDLAELYARKFRKAVQEIQLKPGTFRHVMDSTYLVFSARDDSIHLAYDNDTDHGLHAEHQGDWNERVRSGLEKLRGYESPYFRIYFRR